MRFSRSVFPLFLAFLTPLTAQITLNPIPSRVIGKTSTQLLSTSPNLVEGRELFSPQGIAVDASGGAASAPGLYVADTGNNRVLGFRSASGFANGQKADIVIGQPDFVTTNPQGPGRTNRTTGLSSPRGIAVDKSGNLYIVDTGNNRVLRFPKPFTQTGDQLPDFVIGQPDFTTGTPNQGGISASTLAFTNAARDGAFAASLTFDASGNLWVTDAGNNRVLRYSAASLGGTAANGPAADLILGQPDFVTSAPATSITSFSSFTGPASLVFDSAGRLFVSESIGGRRGRVLVWMPPFTSGKSAARMLGVYQDTPPPPSVSEFQFTAAPAGASAPGALFAIGDHVGIADTFANRLMIFLPVEQWNLNLFYQGAASVVGQSDFASDKVNRGQAFAGPSTLSRPTVAVFFGSELYVADGGNHRVLALPASGASFGDAVRVLGQDALDLNTVNLIEGREFNFTAGLDAGIAVDLSSSVPHLYVADTYNNRILGYRDLRNIQPGAKADIVIGQPDLQHSTVNYPANDATRPNSSGLFGPTGLVVDSAGNLYVADSGNGRVLRFPKPFDNYSPGVLSQPDLLLGQISYNSRISDPTSRTMASPYGLAFAGNHGLLVSDVAHSRVLLFPGRPADLVSGEAATIAFGQPDLNSAGAGSAANQLNSPRHIATDSDDRLYVADSGNGRVQIFDRAPSAGANPSAAVSLTAGLSIPRGMHVNQANGDIWVTDAGTNAAIRYPKFNILSVNGNAPNATLTEFGPMAVAEDAWGNIFVADAANRVVIHYPGLAPVNAASYLSFPAAPLAPGLITALFSTGNAKQFGNSTETAKTIPLPKQLNGVQVLVNNTPAALFSAGPDQINFQMPWNAPQSGVGEIQVLEVATGRILGAGLGGFYTVSPGVFTKAADGVGDAVVVNQDGTLNSQTNQEIQGNIITIYATGQGLVAGAPADGDIPNRPVSTATVPVVVFSPAFLGEVTYSGLAPTLVGVWQINVRVPLEVQTTAQVPVVFSILQNSLASNYGHPVIVYIKRRP